MYNLKYYAELIRGGKTVRLEIHQRDYTGAALRLGTLRSANLGYVGNQSIEAPIIKSELNFTLSDCWKEIRDGYKMGNFEEFYTSDAILYMVKVVENKLVRWTGYLTPDSYTESLVYGGDITFVARDMIGHMADETFDLANDSGMISIADLLTRAREVADIPMSFDTSRMAKLVASVGKDDTPSPSTEWMVNLSAFSKTDSWLDVVEDVLDGIGATMRWMDGNTIVVTPLRYLTDTSINNPVLFECAGQRSMLPAVKNISETFNYESGKPFFVAKSSEDGFTAASMQISDFGFTSNTYVPSPSSQWSRHGNIDLYNHYTLTDSFTAWHDFGNRDDIMMSSIVGRTKAGRKMDAYLYKDIPMSSASAPCRLSFAVEGYALYKFPYNNKLIDFTDITSITAYWGLVAYLEGGEMFYLSSEGGWTKDTPINAVIKEGRGGMESVNVRFTVPAGCIRLQFRFFGFTGVFDRSDADFVKQPSYAYISGLTIEGDYEASGNYVTTTIYNESNNVIYNREPKIGQVPAIPHPSVIPNGLYLDDSSRGYPALQYFAFSGDSERARLSVLVHKQLLCYYDHPCNELSGRLLTQGISLPFGSAWAWMRLRHIIIGGKEELATGNVGSSIIREFVDYDTLWGGMTIAPQSVNLSASGSSTSITVTAPAGKVWTVINDTPWLTVDKQVGRGSGSVTITAQANTAYQKRITTISIAGMLVTVTQAAAAKEAPSWDASDATVTYEAQVVQNISVAANGYDLTFVSSADWLTIADRQGGIVISASENVSSGSRSATVSLKWADGIKSITITQGGQPQAGPTWDATDKIIDRYQQDVYTINVTPSGNDVTLSSSTSWLTLTRNGNAYAVAATANPSDSPRTATITMTWSTGSETVTITQAGEGNARPVWNARDIGVSSEAQTALNIIVQDAGYAVTLNASASWMTITLVSGVYVLDVEENTGDNPRSGAVTMTWNGGQSTVYVTQAASGSVVPTWNAYDANVDYQAQVVMTIFIQDKGTGATLSSSKTWLKITDLGDGNYSISVTRNTSSSSRYGVLTLSWDGGSLSATVGQGGYVATSPVWDAQNMTVDSEAADVQSIVINAYGYSYTLASSETWLTYSKSSDTVKLSVSENDSPEARSATFTMTWSGGSRQITITQLGALDMTPVWSARNATISADAQDVQTFYVLDRGITPAVQVISSPWLSLVQSGINYTLKATANTTGNQRTGRIRMTWSGGSEEIVIIQAAAVSLDPTWDAHDVRLTPDAQVAMIVVINTNGNAVTVSSSQTWCTVSRDGDIVTVSVTDNTGAARSATLTMTWAGGSAFVVITQDQAKETYASVTLVSVVPSTAAVTLNGVDIAVGQFRLVRIGSIITVLATAPGYNDLVGQMTVTEDIDLELTLNRESSKFEVSLNLWNCSASNVDTEATEGGPYSNTITPAPGYAIGDSVIVQMGGTTLTDVITRNLDGTVSIYIPRVTGNIGITVFAA